MIKLALSGAIWLEELPGREWLIEVPPDSRLYEKDDVDAESSFDQDHRTVVEPNKAYVVWPGGNPHLQISFMLCEPHALFTLSQGEWCIVTASAPRTIDRRRTAWERLREND